MTEEPIPISKNCGKCKETKLLSEFNLLHGSSDRSAICKSCPTTDQDYEPYGTCCPEHFQDMMITNVFTQLETLLQTVDVIGHNGVEIPSN